MMKYFLYGFLFLALGACRTAPRTGELVGVANYPKIKHYLPEALRNVDFGMPKGQFLAIYSGFVANETMGFRSEVVTGFDDAALKTVTYYFDKQGAEPLYEVILEYRTAEQRDQVAQQLFKKPNHEGGQWRYQSRKGFPIWAWTFQNKLIVVAPLPGTEWDETKY